MTYIVGKGEVATGVDAVLQVRGAGHVADGGELVVEGVDVGLDDMVPKLSEHTKGLVVVAEERRPHVGGDLADDGIEGIFELDHGADDTGVAEGGEVGVSIGMRADLVSVGNHAADDILEVVDVAEVVAVDEEGSLGKSAPHIMWPR